MNYDKSAHDRATRMFEEAQIAARRVYSILRYSEYPGLPYPEARHVYDKVSALYVQHNNLYHSFCVLQERVEELEQETGLENKHAS